MYALTESTSDSTRMIEMTAHRLTTHFDFPI